ncbi:MULTISPECIES: hypothetical protein [unclassified Lysobacter]|uniref:hypothetical protein n=1 Tax=unclassified Lysobacter TaxID=2635362 RepID=UPI001BEB7E5D|nr:MULTISPECIES: hypothetical protein [unclassified Lysobacter]MBT2745618.1 hypothetical protein [Lysobacter sp. ISL-42]MBT2753557.1 hypothetical protein [Lysobacter sp. ISL-50]MBT2777059.1 hypothetical protein [Lysobacter sp. ISL-54]MBT2780315.1 hypothetical protein [Lysobacter sp. ISL-52]
MEANLADNGLSRLPESEPVPFLAMDRAGTDGQHEPIAQADPMVLSTSWNLFQQTPLAGRP